MKTQWLNRLMNEAGDTNGGGGAPPPVETPATPPVETPVDKTALGYKDTENQNALGYKEHKEPESKELKFDRTGHDESTIKLVESYAEANELTEKQTESFAKFIKGLKDTSDAAKNKSVEAQKAADFTKMQADFKILKDHPEFGKDTEKSFMEAGKVLDLMPDFKKQLTATGKHADPILMIALKGLYSKLYGQDGTIITGGKVDTESNLPIWDQIYGKK